jgi:hypothetical protein
VYTGVEEIGFKWLYSGGDSLLHVDVCCKTLSSHALQGGFRELYMTGQILLTGLVIGYGATTRRLCTALCTVPPSRLAIPSVTGDYVYVRCVTSATHVLCNKALGLTMLVVLLL